LPVLKARTTSTEGRPQYISPTAEGDQNYKTTSSLDLEPNPKQWTFDVFKGWQAELGECAHSSARRDRWSSKSAVTQADARLRDRNAYRFAEATQAPTREARLFEPFAENQDGCSSHCDYVNPWKQHRDQHQRPARTGAPTPVRNPETQCVHICGGAKGGKFAMSVATIEATLLDWGELPNQRYDNHTGCRQIRVWRE
jgi:hypothetical protein